MEISRSGRPAWTTLTCDAFVRIRHLNALLFPPITTRLLPFARSVTLKAGPRLDTRGLRPVGSGAVDAEPTRQALPIPPTRDITMAQCEVCGNDYELSFEVIAAGNRHVFDSFECAIFKLAPVCDHCGVKIIGHGIQGNGAFYCCAHCARHEGETGAVDHL